jgi:hypothetical protein
MKTAGALTQEQLVHIVEQVQGLLYQDLDPDGRKCWNPGKNWSPDLLDDLVRALDEYGLVPTRQVYLDDGATLLDDESAGS